ncbi:Uu.00g012100.m01.CDS01 [Anthostomella pinea]|uniref:Uu.00g012100.m01.CDS01 n=1 Tax=Anthostomella pinea TaxID=933095 RepID=A0AAI8VS44_9PEZI|nr:Uu.00g012100.m01.CDS01 [Anthostomella pinea]
MAVYYLQTQSAFADAIRHCETGRIVETGRVGVCGERFDYVEMFSNPSWRAALTTGLAEKLIAFNRNIVLVGVQNERSVGDQGRVTYEFVVISIWDLDEQRRWSFEQTRRQLAAWGLQTPRLLGQSSLWDIGAGTAKAAYGHTSPVGLVFESLDGGIVFGQD